MASAADYQLDHMVDQWVHPETGCRINAEDMPGELLPEHTEQRAGVGLAMAARLFARTVAEAFRPLTALG